MEGFHDIRSPEGQAILYQVSTTKAERAGRPVAPAKDGEMYWTTSDIDARERCSHCGRGRPVQLAIWAENEHMGWLYQLPCEKCLMCENGPSPGWLIDGDQAAIAAAIEEYAWDAN